MHAKPVDPHDFDASSAVHVGRDCDMTDVFCEPLAMTSAYTFASARDAWERFSGQKEGNVYTRFTNPTVRAFERRIAHLEGADDAVAFASGMGAIASLCHALLQQGDGIVCSRDVFGTTVSAFRHYMGRFGIRSRFAELTDLSSWAEAIDERTRLVVLESPSNPTLKVGDIRAICRLAHARGALVAVDNTLLTPVFQRPHRLGADLVIHSAGKYIDGQGRALAGVVTGSPELMKELRGVLRTLGTSCSPFNAWLLLKSLETLDVRMQRVQDSALALADWIGRRESVLQVHYTGLESHPQRDLACRQQHGHGGLLSFCVRGGQSAAWQWIDALQLVARCTNIGDTRSMATHPATTTHCRLSEAERHTAGIADGLLRLSVGLEALDDLKVDLGRAFDVIERGAAWCEPVRAVAECRS
ncbi:MULTISPECIES: PLP-dependent aspartate aminotransferase family protein [Pseudomonadaceae]|uniref:O-succinylhomoserine sulfhydrylase n=1 Tax=Ectopseudomonas oleovorans TaxID=301 RepID=A0A2T5PK90_ECTOL|nr:MULTISPECIES: aminotransferase class I/II-fold pyridoxal phosphate-dependent enzyme [Pseudomonas]MDH2197786.1 aminotransferase class I/II-fold pyridoxal phosphate-dependent enzyme [Pseudomonas oleovorans]PTU78130.1 O-succinylhomoserine sulfhydrylase [Pseudomonas indoloxydans]WGL62543.1 aminotransferase class I/II-fold pyridoxal phosphate-dependent enzyme [Pseudomonas sp. CW003PS]